MRLLSFLTMLVASHTLLVYALLLVAVTFEGELALLILGVLAHAKIIPITHALIIGIVGAILKTLWSYHLGVALKKYVPKNGLFDFIERKVHGAFPHFQNKPFLSIFLSKFIYGLNHLTAIFSGYTGVPFKKYATAELSSSAIWLIFMFTLGYFFSQAAFSVTHNIQKVAIIILAAIIGFLILSRCIEWVIEWAERD
jgi:membrane protein DedA with SNARE-associated domain